MLLTSLWSTGIGVRVQAPALATTHLYICVPSQGAQGAIQCGWSRETEAQLWRPALPAPPAASPLEINHQASHKHGDSRPCCSRGPFHPGDVYFLESGLSWSPKSGPKAAWAQSPALPLASCVTLDKLLKSLHALVSSREWVILYLTVDERKQIYSFGSSSIQTVPTLRTHSRPNHPSSFLLLDRLGPEKGVRRS